MAILVFFMLIWVMHLKSGASVKNSKFAYDYGVFLSVGPESIPKMSDYKTIVIDAQNDFTKKDIKKLKRQGHIVYSYINIGSVETYRKYYDDYKDITLGAYENWPDERWVDVSDEKSQHFVIDELSSNIISLGVDGFFVDNTDVYYNYPSDEIYNGITSILIEIKKKGKVIINGGDTYVTRYLEENNNLKDVLDGVNQESVFSKIIDYEENKFGSNDKESVKYYKKYLAKVKKNKKKIYILEYTQNNKLKNKIKKYCKKKGYRYYITEDLDLS